MLASRGESPAVALTPLNTEALSLFLDGRQAGKRGRDAPRGVRYNPRHKPTKFANVSRRVLIAIAVIIVIIVTGMVITMKRAFRADALARDPDASVPKRAAPQPRQP